MVVCTPQRRICFFWSIAGVIATETCVFFILLLIFTAEKYENSAQTAVDYDASSHSRHAAIPILPNKSKGFLTFLPSHRKTFTVDFLNSSAYKRNMDMISEKYSAKNLRDCLNIPLLELHDCNSQSSYGIQQSVFCLVARLEHTGKWIPDQFLPVDWLPNYDPDYLPITCEVIAQNSSIRHRGRSYDFHYRQKVSTVWPANGFRRNYFGKDVPNDCYPPVTIKIDDPFVLSYPHELVSVTCRVWSYNSNLLQADSVSINVTLRNREDAQWNVARKVLVPLQTAIPLNESNETKAIVHTTETATAQVIPSSTTDPKPVDLSPVPVFESMPCSTCTNAPFPLTESRVPSTPSLLTITVANTYMDFMIPSAFSHESSIDTTPAEFTTPGSNTEALSWRAQSTSQTESDFQTSIFSVQSGTDEKTDEATTEPISDQNTSVFLGKTVPAMDEVELDTSGDSSWSASRQTTLDFLDSINSSPILIDTTLLTRDHYDEDTTIEEGFILTSPNGPQLDFTTTLETSQYSQNQDLMSTIQPAKTEAFQAVYSASFVTTPALSLEDTTSASASGIPTQTTTTDEIEHYDTPSFPEMEQTIPDQEASGDTSTDDITSRTDDSFVKNLSTTISANMEQATSSSDTLQTSSLVLESTSFDYDNYENQPSKEFSSSMTVDPVELLNSTSASKMFSFEDFSLIPPNGSRLDYTTMLDESQYSQEEGFQSAVQHAMTGALNSSFSFLSTETLPPEDATSGSTSVLPTQTTFIPESEDYDSSPLPTAERDISDPEASGGIPTDDGPRDFNESSPTIVVSNGDDRYVHVTAETTDYSKDKSDANNILLSTPVTAKAAELSEASSTLQMFSSVQDSVSLEEGSAEDVQFTHSSVTETLDVSRQNATPFPETSSAENRPNLVTYESGSTDVILSSPTTTPDPLEDSTFTSETSRSEHDLTRKHNADFLSNSGDEVASIFSSGNDNPVTITSPREEQEVYTGKFSVSSELETDHPDPTETYEEPLKVTPEDYEDNYADPLFPEEEAKINLYGDNVYTVVLPQGEIDN